jgi:hypothetical protein
MCLRRRPPMHRSSESIAALAAALAKAQAELDAMTEEERHRAALSDRNCPPATEAQLARARRVPTVRALRRKLKLT